MKARSRAAHPAVDWLYTVATATAAAEHACLQPSPELPWSVLLHNQVKLAFINFIDTPWTFCPLNFPHTYV